ncbi:hypothetical protein [Oceanospirillum sediminis]|uniref:Uncharacterized protein n=1 Tax=Oceanospirillum sediminis TaxID=2760088 RepID=A0A839IWN5_9GAMM|nr:hypothetical protein [Oceanospirillum sediminis]MBB1489182.1 hypothetical protein [Oceanospirillum sediminis]
MASVEVLAGSIRIAHDVGYVGTESLDPISPSRFFYANQMLYSRQVRQGTNGEPAPEIAISAGCAA